MNITIFYEPKTNKLQFNRGVSLTADYSFEDLHFNIPQQCVPEGTSVFLIMRQQSGARDVIELTRSGSIKASYNYMIYSAPVTQAVKIKSGPAMIALMLLDANDVAIVTEYLGINLDILKYQFTHQIALLRNTNIAVTEHYEKIVQLLMNLIEKGETNYDSKDDCRPSGTV